MSAGDPFAAFEGWEDVDGIKRDVEQTLARGAGVSVETLRTALRRLVYDGHYGPVSDADWRAIDGTRMSISRATKIVRAVQDAELPAVRLYDPDTGYLCDGAETCLHEDHEQLGDPGPLFHQEPIEISRADLLEWYFAALHPIYGRIDI